MERIVKADLTTIDGWATLTKTFTAQSTVFMRWYFNLSSGNIADATTMRLNALGVDGFFTRRVRAAIYNDTGTLKWRLEYYNDTVYDNNDNTPIIKIKFKQQGFITDSRINEFTQPKNHQSLLNIF